MCCYEASLQLKVVMKFHCNWKVCVCSLVFLWAALNFLYLMVITPRFFSQEQFRTMSTQDLNVSGLRHSSACVWWWGAKAGTFSKGGTYVHPWELPWFPRAYSPFLFLTQEEKHQAKGVPKGPSSLTCKWSREVLKSPEVHVAKSSQKYGVSL